MFSMWCIFNVSISNNYPNIYIFFHSNKILNKKYPEIGSVCGHDSIISPPRLFTSKLPK